jgi:hypothetical protein
MSKKFVIKHISIIINLFENEKITILLQKDILLKPVSIMSANSDMARKIYN